MTRRNVIRSGVLVIVGVLFAYLLGPPIVKAATSIVTIQGVGGVNRAGVTHNHRLLVDSEAAVKKIRHLEGENGKYLRVATQPGGGTVVNFGRGDSPFAFCAVMTAIVANGRSSGGTVTLATEGTLVWTGKIPSGGGHIGDAFPDGVFTGEMDVTAPNGVDWIVYGRPC
jgi:hypothetical protein